MMNAVPIEMSALPIEWNPAEARPVGCLRPVGAGSGRE